MTHYLVDTNVVSETARDAPDGRVVDWLDRTASDLLYVSVMTLGELRLGIEKLPIGRRRLHLELWLGHEVPRWFGANKLSVTEAIADRWGRLIVQARRNGLTLQTSDGLIAATAAEHGLTLVTRNIKDFQNLDVPLLHPWD